MTLVVGEQSRTIIAQRRLHVFLEYFFGLKKMTVTVNNHKHDLVGCCPVVINTLGA
jgi:hypothetical protein